MFLRKFVMFVLMISLMAFSSDVEKIIKDLQSKTDRLDSKINAVRGILEGKIADLSANVDIELSKVRTDLNTLNAKVTDLSDTVIALGNLVKKLGDSLSATYENQKALLETIESLRKKLDESYSMSQRALQSSNEALNIAKTSKVDSTLAIKMSQTNRLLIYLALVTSVSSLVLSVYVFSINR